MNKKTRDINHCYEAYLSTIPELIREGKEETYTGAMAQLQSISNRLKLYKETKKFNIGYILPLISALKNGKKEKIKILGLLEKTNKEFKLLNDKSKQKNKKETSDHSLESNLRYQESLNGGEIRPPQ